MGWNLEAFPNIETNKTTGRSLITHCGRFFSLSATHTPTPLLQTDTPSEFHPLLHRNAETIRFELLLWWETEKKGSNKA